MTIFELHQKFKECNQNISTDTRSISPGCLFFALRGGQFDGNQFATEALKKGARYVVVDDSERALDDRYFLVTDTTVTLQDLAQYHRKQFDVPVLAIAGSNGKTTTKELVHRVLSTQKDVVASFASFNNHIGVPKTLLRINDQTDIVVVELGANHLGEIKKLCEITQPTHGIVTNIGRDHIGLFGGEGAIIESNLELYHYLRDTGGHAFVNKNDNLLMKYVEAIAHTCYGESIPGEFGIFSFHTNPFVSFSWHHKKVKTQLTGEYNIENINAALAVGVHFNIQTNNIMKAISSFTPETNRSEIFVTKSNIVIKDFYNANRTSMELALCNLAEIGKSYPEKKTMAILGDMFELGEYSKDEHQAVVDLAESLSIDEIILVGNDMANTKHSRAKSYPTTVDAIKYLWKHAPQNMCILLKASNGMKFQKIFDEVDW